MVHDSKRSGIAVALVAALALVPVARADTGAATDEEDREAEAALRFLQDDFWGTGTIGTRDEEGRLVYVVRTRLVPRSAASLTQPPGYGANAVGANGYYLRHPTLVRGTPRRSGSPSSVSASGASAGTNAAPSSRRVTPSAPSPRRSGNRPRPSRR